MDKARDKFIFTLTTNKKKRRKTMKKLMVQLFVISVVIATYALPVLATGGGGP